MGADWGNVPSWLNLATSGGAVFSALWVARRGWNRADKAQRELDAQKDRQTALQQAPILVGALDKVRRTIRIFEDGAIIDGEEFAAAKAEVRWLEATVRPLPDRKIREHWTALRRLLDEVPLISFNYSVYNPTDRERDYHVEAARRVVDWLDFMERSVNAVVEDQPAPTEQPPPARLPPRRYLGETD